MQNEDVPLWISLHQIPHGRLHKAGTVGDAKWNVQEPLMKRDLSTSLSLHERWSGQKIKMDRTPKQR